MQGHQIMNMIYNYTHDCDYHSSFSGTTELVAEHTINRDLHGDELMHSLIQSNELTLPLMGKEIVFVERRGDFFDLYLRDKQSEQFFRLSQEKDTEGHIKYELWEIFPAVSDFIGPKVPEGGE